MKKKRDASVVAQALRKDVGEDVNADSHSILYFCVFLFTLIASLMLFFLELWTG
jgi:hypothetical protein